MICYGSVQFELDSCPKNLGESLQCRICWWGGVLNGSIVGNRQTDLTSTYGIPFSMVRMPDTKFLAGLIVHM